MKVHPHTVIIDYGVGNIASIANMIRRLGYPCIVSSSPEAIEKAERIILCGVGAFDDGMQRISAMGIRTLLDEKVLVQKTPILGVCLGMQLLTEGSEEGKLPGLGYVQGSAQRFDFSASDDKSQLKVPHMGWNIVYPQKTSRLLEEMYPDPRFYFVHSYQVTLKRPEDVLLTCNYGNNFCAAFEKDNIVGVQFHPEKSHKYGLLLYKNFISKY